VLIEVFELRPEKISAVSCSRLQPIISNHLQLRFDITVVASGSRVMVSLCRLTG